MTHTTFRPTSRMTTNQPTPRDYRQEVTDSIIRLLEEGTAPWQKPWDASGSTIMPFNPTTEKPYRGGNAMYLLAVGMKRGYSDPRWMTYKQAAENGWQVKKGEKGTLIEFWDVKPVIGENSPDDRPDETPERREKRLIHKVYTVFNARQIEHIPPLTPKKHTAFEAIQAGENILTHSGAAIHHDQFDKAFYSRSKDSIHLPPREVFTDAPGYYGTALHELAHWTGHPDRLNRSTLTAAYRFGDTNYAREELRAELASMFLAAERGIPHQPERHAAYVASWIKALKDDKNEIFRAAQDAAKITDYILDLERDKPAPETPAPQPQETHAAALPIPSTITHAGRVKKSRELTLEMDFDGPG